MNLDLAENTNKLILLVVAGVALLLTLNTYQKHPGTKYMSKIIKMHVKIH